MSTKLAGVQLGLVSDSGKWVVAEAGGGGLLYANRTSQGPWETVYVRDFDRGWLLNGDEIALQTDGGYYICAESGGGQELIANRVSPGPWERFRIYNTTGHDPITTGDSIYIKASNNQYWVAEYGGNDVVNANRSTVGPWEKFSVKVNKNSVNLVSAYIDVNGDGISDEVFAAGTFRNSVRIDSWTTECYDYWYYPVELAFSFWDYGWGGFWPFTPDFSWIWLPDLFWLYDSSYAVCDTYVESVTEFTTEADSTYRIYKDSTGSTNYNPANWELVVEGVFGEGLQSIYGGLEDASSTYSTQYFIVKLGDTGVGNLYDGADAYIRTYTGPDPVASLLSSYSLSWDENEDPIGGQGTPDAAWGSIKTRLEQLMGSLTLDEVEFIKMQGCLGIFRRLMGREITIFGSTRMEYPSALTRPELDDRWEVTGYAHYSDADAHVCPNGKRKVICAVMGNWTNGAPPSNSVTVDLEDITPTNWVTQMPPPNENTWVYLSHGLGDVAGKHVPQTLHVLAGDPVNAEDFPDFPMIFLVVCVDE